MKTVIEKIPVVQLPSGDTLNIKAYTFIGDKPGKKVYIQANIHGPEVVGSGVLLKLVDLIKTKGIKTGQLKLVISANPIGVNTKISGYQVGYTNIFSTAKYSNWGKIFKLDTNSVDKTHGIQIEDKLGQVLFDLSKGYDFALDIHSAQNNIETIYCFSNSLDLVQELDVKHVIIPEDKFAGCFDEMCYFSSGKKVHSFTLELSGNLFNEIYLEKWADDLFNWIEDLSIPSKHIPGSIHKKIIWPYEADKKYFSKLSGITLPLKKPGDSYKQGEKLAEILSLDGQSQIIIAKENGFVYKYPLCQVVSEGEEVIGVLEGKKYVGK